jgi:hypothetical protein
VIRIFVLFMLSYPLWGQCGKLVVNPTTGWLDCVGSSTTSTTRTLWNPNAGAAIIQAGIPVTPFSLPTSGAPTPTADADATQAYLTFAADTTQTVYARTKLPSDWAGTLIFAGSAYAGGTGALQTFNIQTACVGSGATTNPTYNTADAVSVTPAVTRVTFSKTLVNGLTGCAAGRSLYVKIVIKANAGYAFNLLEAQITE